MWKVLPNVFSPSSYITSPDASCGHHRARDLTIDGDIEKNPGPAHKYPCGLCNCNVGYYKKKYSIKCSKCKNWWHQDCAKLTTNEIKTKVKEIWTCPKCAHKIKKNNKDKRQDSQWNILNILQWNADSLPSKKIELSKILEDHKIDVAIIQETKLTPNMKFQIKGYTTIRKDRTTARNNDNVISGGGVATIIKEGLAYKNTQPRTTGGNDYTTESCSVTVSKLDQPIRITNIYVPPIRTTARDTRIQNFDPKYLPWNDADIIGGDFNMHAKEWDPIKEEDRLGIETAEEAIANNFEICNNGEHTFTSRIHASKSTPDITFCRTNMRNKITWNTIEDIDSDHLPIKITLQLNNQSIKKNKSNQRKYNYKKANWPEYQSFIKQKTDNWRERLSLQEHFNTLNKIITEAAETHIPKKKKNSGKIWWNERCQEAVKKRHVSRKEAERDPQKKEEWNRIAKETRQTILEEKKKSWQEVVSHLNIRTDSRKVWNIIKGIDGKSSTFENPAMTINQQDIFEDRKKANILMKCYCKESRLENNKENALRNRKIKRNTYKFLQKKCHNCENNKSSICKPFTKEELRSAMQTLNMGKAEGEDGISNEMLLHLPEAGLEKLIEGINLTWSEGKIPLEWTKANIIPILKKGKPEDNPSSYRPISLTSCTCKLAERMVLRRLTYFLDENRILCKEQAGFRSHRSTEDQIIRIQHEITKGFNSKKPAKRTLLTLIDFSKAFDTIWRKGLLSKLISYNIPTCMLRWIKSFLTNRTAKVKLNQSTSKRMTINEGVPQGGVLSPLLFILFVNDIGSGLDHDIHYSLFADDLAIWTQDTNPKVCRRKMQKALDKIQEWTKKWRMRINESKTEYILFTPWNKESKWTGQLTVNGKNIKQNNSPKFLGIEFDWNLTFSQHTDKVTKIMAKRSKALRAVANKEWGCRNEDLRALYIGYIRSICEYAGAAWHNATSKTNISKLEKEQNKAARSITGCFKSTPVDILLAEANLEPINCRKDYLAAKSKEKFLRDDDNPNSLIAAENPIARTQKAKNGQTWRGAADKLIRLAKLSKAPREPLNKSDKLPPWTDINRTNIIFHTQLTQDCTKKDSPNKIKEITEKTLEENGVNNADIQIWTDGSAKDGTTNGGGGIIIRRGNEEDINLEVPAGLFCSSYVAEMKALREGIKHCTNINVHNSTIAIMLDNQGAIRKISAGPLNQKDNNGHQIWKFIKTLLDRNNTIIVQWVPGHVGIEYNEKVDSIAKQATKLDQSRAQIDLDSCKTVLKRTMKLNNEQSRVSSRYDEWKINREDEKTMSRKERTLLAQIRSHHCLLARSYRHRIGTEDSPNCTYCLNTPETIPHILQTCPNWTSQRIKTFGTPSPYPDCMSGRDILTFVRRIGHKADAHGQPPARRN